MSPLTNCPAGRHQPMLLPVGFRISNRIGFRSIIRAALLLALTVGGANSWAQTWISAVSATNTASSAIVTWSTAVPADSQVEYGTTASYGSVTALAAAKVAIHSVALSGLTDLSLQGTFERCERFSRRRPRLLSYHSDSGHDLAFTSARDDRREWNATVYGDGRQ